MSHPRHHTIVVTGAYPQKTDEGGEHWTDIAREKALEIFGGTKSRWAPLISPVLASPYNDVRSFFIAPDGSGEGWDASDEGDSLRDQFVAWLESVRYGDQSTPLDWIEVQYGDGDGENLVLAGSSRMDVLQDSDAPLRAPCPLGCPHPVSYHGSDGCVGERGSCACTWIR
jgi:hypothetical protein